MPVQRILPFSQNKNDSSFQSQHINELDTSRHQLVSDYSSERKKGGRSIRTKSWTNETGANRNF